MSSPKKADYESESNESSGHSDDDDNSSDEDLYGHTDENRKDAEHTSSEVSEATKKGQNKNEETNKQYPVTFVCTALSDFSSKEASDLSFEKGEMLTIINIRKDGWWEARNSDSIQGLVPSTFLKIPDHVNVLINELLSSDSARETHHWSNLRSSLRKAHAVNTALQTFGTIGLPMGFRESLLGTLLKQDKSYTMENYLIPKLSDSGLSFEDMHWEPLPSSANKITMQLKPVTTALQKVIQLVALRQIIPPPPGYDVTSRHIHMCLHDGNKVLSNIHTTKAGWDPKNPKIWLFGGKISIDGSCIEEGQIFIRSNKSFATLGILFELCVSYKKKDSSNIDEMSCGWAFMRLLNDSGVPVKSRTKILKIHNSIPFTNNLDSSSASIGSLQKFMNKGKQPRMVISISSPKRSSGLQICYLPSTLIGPVSSIPLMALYRKVISDDLLQRKSFDCADLIQSPFLANFPRMFKEPDLIDFFRKAWAERVKHDKHHDLRTESKKLNAFCSLFMETVFLIMNSCNLPPFSIGNSAYEQERKVLISKVMASANPKDHGILALSTDLEFKPLTTELLSTYVI